MYLIYIKDSAEKTVIIDEGFAPLALIFNAMWFALHRMWGMGALILLANCAAKYWLAYSENLAPAAMLCLISLFCGLFANDLRQRSLIKNGYRFYSAVVAKNIAEAQVKMYASLDQEKILKA